MNGYIKAATHNGPFHADDVVAGAIIGLAFRWKVEFIRTRDPEVLATAEVVYDVGGVYDPETCRFDHHQRGCDARWQRMNRLSSAGMLWSHYGLQLVRQEVGDMEEDAEVGEVWQEVYKTFIQFVDDLDNGGGPLTQGTLSDATFSSVIGDINCVGEATEADHFAAYMHAVELARGALLRRIRHAAHSVRQRTAIRAHGSQRLLVLDEAVDPVLVAESTRDTLLLVVPQYGQWMVICVPPSRGERFQQRLPLPEEWAGRRGPALAEVLARGPAKDAALADTTGATSFVHSGRFCGGMRTREGAIDLAHQALADADWS